MKGIKKCEKCGDEMHVHIEDNHLKLKCDKCKHKEEI